MSKLPPSLKSLDFPVDSKFFKGINIPASVTHLSIRQLVDTFPPSLKALTMSSLDIATAKLPVFPPSITKLDLQNFYTFPDNLLPPNLTILKVGNAFNYPLDNLPSTLKQLSFPYYSKFNHPVDKLPASLLTLSFGSDFNHPVEHLPQTLQQITFGNNFNHQLHHLPAGLEVLSFYSSSNFEQTITFPTKLRVLHIPRGTQMTVPELPRSLQRLKIASAAQFLLSRLPPHLFSLSSSGHCIQHVTSFPASLNNLNLHDPVLGPLHTIPPECVVTLNVATESLQDIPIAIRPLVKQIDISLYSPIVSLSAFSSMSSIDFPYSFNDYLPILPNSVIVLELRDYFNRPLPALPQHLQVLKLGNAFTHPADNLPASLLILHIGYSFNRPFNDLPRSLRQLMLANPNYSCKLDKLPLSIVEFVTPLDPSAEVFQTIPPQLQHQVCRLKSYTYIFASIQLTYNINNFYHIMSLKNSWA